MLWNDRMNRTATFLTVPSAATVALVLLPVVLLLGDDCPRAGTLLLHTTLTSRDWRRRCWSPARPTGTGGSIS
jgi:hypothetical protein